MTALNPLMEAMFQQWYKAWAQLQGWDPNPDGYGQDYDYRGLYKSGDGPAVDETDNNTLHWTSQFKLAGHPREILPMDDGLYLNTKTGEQSTVPSYGLQLQPYLAGLGLAKK